MSDKNFYLSTKLHVSPPEYKPKLEPEPEPELEPEPHPNRQFCTTETC